MGLISEACFEPLLGSDNFKPRFCYHRRTHVEYGVLAAQKTMLKQFNRDTDDSENVTRNEAMLMRAIIGMFIKIDLLLESRN